MEQFCHILGGREGKGRDTGEATQQGQQLPHRHQESKAQLEVQGPSLCPSDQSWAEKVRVPAASDEKVGLEPMQTC